VKRATFSAEVLEGHKGPAVEVPFDPAARWGTPPVPLWRGRRGHPVRGRLNGRAFESVIVPRSRRFYVLVGAEVPAAFGIEAGETVRVTLQPTERAFSRRGPTGRAR
jgi:hypothetical protein